MPKIRDLLRTISLSTLNHFALTAASTSTAQIIQRHKENVHDDCQDLGLRILLRNSP